MTKLKLVFFGNECLSSSDAYNRAPILEALLGQNYNVEALIISQRATKSRSVRHLAILEAAQKNNIPIIKIQNTTELEAAVQSLQSETAVLVSFGFIITPIVLEHFAGGIINVHPSLLPRHRGPTPIETALLENNQETGISLIRLSPQLDSGPIYAQKKLAIQAQESKLSLTSRLADSAAQLLIEKLPLIFQRKLEPQEQDHSRATYSTAITPQEPLDFNKYRADYLECHIRAFAGCPNNKFQLNNYLVEIETARISSHQAEQSDVSYNKASQSLYVKCLKDSLEIKQLKPSNRKSMTAADFVNGFYRQLLER